MKVSHVRLAHPLVALAASLLLPAIACAQDVVMTSNPDKWQFTALLYGWVPTINGSVNFPISNSGGNFTADPNTIFNNLNLAAMGTVGVMYNRFGFFTDFLYMSLGHTKNGYKDFTLPNQEPGNLSASVNLGLNSWIVTSAFQYRVVEIPDLAVNVLAGARYLYMKPSLSWYFSANLVNNPGIPRGNERSQSGDNIDAIVGLKGEWTFGSNHAWGLPFYADIGGGDSKLTWQLAGGISYHLGAWEIGAMYRKLNYHLSTAGLTDLSIDGPMVGAAYRF
jgi:hypothetical protein